MREQRKGGGGRQTRWAVLLAVHFFENVEKCVAVTTAGCSRCAFRDSHVSRPNVARLGSRARAPRPRFKKHLLATTRQTPPRVGTFQRNLAVDDGVRNGCLRCREDDHLAAPPSCPANGLLLARLPRHAFFSNVCTGPVPHIFNCQPIRIRKNMTARLNTPALPLWLSIG